ncbi:hypothetical protein CFC21_025578 [Triticum aestivum]|uniref:rRNA N-glycosylase n=2 Tax=Triticum aestivum TaxID=4565 RepID=A0A9R1EJL8_WHEAT|nr:protein synthesis inhibitor II-like [Triticum aestivum]KAF7011249.1 hypothetical protein CFC21_025578 [Triticum aestivum]
MFIEEKRSIDRPNDRFAMATFLLFLILALAAGSSNHGGAAAAAGDARPALAVMTLHSHDPESPSVAFQTHDLSFAGFTNGGGHWQAFPGLAHLFPTSTPLPFGSSYDDLIGGLAKLPGVPLGRQAMADAARVLSAYDPSAAAVTDVEPVKRALAALKVMLGEAQRLQPIHETVVRGWESESRVAPEHLPYIDHWDTISYEIIRANRTGKWNGPFAKMLETQANIRSQEEALAVVRVLLHADFEQVLEAHGTKINFQ